MASWYVGFVPARDEAVASGRCGLIESLLSDEAELLRSKRVDPPVEVWLFRQEIVRGGALQGAISMFVRN
jgi:hypothetical protein